ncbi:MAG: hypothetical protein CL674_00630 [Bdellovibrionaceae bacterium]|nr:hypothetical protein [Pseudobdellovibrionaceae bacterium]|tara:strand:- start:19253 stop:19768 length:516 start_codon:yes stop_codon:yes gene_type:complete
MKHLILAFVIFGYLAALADSQIGSFASNSDSGIAATSADIDGDGDVDIIFATTIGGTVSLLRNDGQGRFVNSKIGSFKSWSDSGVAIISTDVDSDGDIDIIFATTRGGTVNLLKNNGKGHFSKSLIASFESWSNSGVALTSTDLDGDGDIDIVLATTRGGSISVLENIGSW